MAKPGELSQSEESDASGTQQSATEPPKKEEVDLSDSAIANPVMSRPAHPSTPTSIIIQALLNKLCQLYNDNREESKENFQMICDMLYKMNIIDSSYKMNEFESIRNQYQSSIHNMLSITTNGDSKASLSLRQNRHNIEEHSHYKQEFEELNFIAGGGFGQVFRVRHKLDKMEYAIKKIFIESYSLSAVEDYFKEVRTFANMNHPNIVQYKMAWLELGVSQSDLVDADDEFTEDNYTEHLVDSNFPDFSKDLQMLDEECNGSSNFEISFESVTHHSLNGTQKSTRRVKRSSVSEGDFAICKVEDIRNLQIRNHRHPKWATLFIQMALCQSTLKQWLENRNAAETKSRNEAALIPVNNVCRNNTVLLILKQVLQGLEYMHSKQMVHHDIKPSNIFLQYDNGALLVQLGDFGLACPLQRAKHSLAFGTELYAAPEQLQGKCDPKSDMYSLGIVIFELIETFGTDMERVTSITLLRKKGVGEFVQNQHPLFAKLIGNLMCKQVEKRPTASQLLNELDNKRESDSNINELKNQLRQKDEEILRLKEQLRRKMKSGS